MRIQTSARGRARWVSRTALAFVAALLLEAPRRRRRPQHLYRGRHRHRRVLGRRRAGYRRPVRRPVRGGGERRRRLPDHRLRQPSGAVRRRRPALPAGAGRTDGSAGARGTTGAGGTDGSTGARGTTGAGRAGGSRAAGLGLRGHAAERARAAPGHASLRGDRARGRAGAGSGRRTDAHPGARPGAGRRQPDPGPCPAASWSLPAADRGPHDGRPRRRRRRSADRPQARSGGG